MFNENERQVLTNLLNGQFDNVQLDPIRMIDAQATVRGTNIQFYVIYQPVRPTDDKVKQLFKQIDVLPNANYIFKHSIVIIAGRGIDCEFAIMLYNEHGYYHLNKEIRWRKYSDVYDIEWLNQQLKVRNNHIELLPQDMWLIKKTIFLNSEEINEAEIIYFRTLTNDYKMNSPQGLSEKDKFNRILYGTPEKDYPKDALDDIIYQRFVAVYPNARVKSETFLFSTDLANIRIKKEKLLYSFKLYFVAISYDNALEQYVAKQEKQTDIDIELLYYPNILGRNNIIPINQVVQMDDNIIDVISCQKRTYKPISSINI